MLFYNETKGGIDTVDQMLDYYSCRASTKRWSMTVFFMLLDVAALNSWVVMTSKPSPFGDGRHGGRRAFLMVDSHWRPAVRSPVQYGPGRLVSPSGTDMKLVNGPGSGVNARRPAPSARPASDTGRSFVQAREGHFYRGSYKRSYKLLDSGFAPSPLSLRLNDGR